MKKAISILVLGLMAGCATTSYHPTVDTYNNANVGRLGQDMAECRQLALQASGGTARKTTEGALMGGAFGAALGAVVGAMTGNPGKGAAMGAAVGGVGGGGAGAYQNNEEFKIVYRRCLRARGHNVVD